MRLFTLTTAFFIAIISVIGANANNTRENQPKKEIEIADSILLHVLRLYDVPQRGLLLETYPVNPNQKVDYLAEGAVQKQNQEVSFLWPYSGVLSGVVSLFKETKDEKYLALLEQQILPGLEKYWDTGRAPYAYQSYPVFAGNSDRFYDDNVWIALDFCTLYESTHDKKHLDRALQLYDFIFSGWDEALGGGIYWCEQKKTSKNTCSNAPSAVLCARLFAITKEQKYLRRAIETYDWTKDNFRDPADNVYWDNMNMEGKMDKRKYTYNSGQMIEAAAVLYRITDDKKYLSDAQKTAEATFAHFVENKETPHGISPFYPSSPWFNTILFRGLKALYVIDGNKKYVQVMCDNAQYAFNNTRDENQLFGNKWHEKSENRFKWLLDNACMIELFSEMSSL